MEIIKEYIYLTYMAKKGDKLKMYSFRKST